MSEDFMNIILKSSTASTDEKIKKLSMVLDKIMEVAIKSISGIETQVQSFDSLLTNIENDINNLESEITIIKNRPQVSIAIQTDIEPTINQQRLSSPKPVQQKPKPALAPVNPRTALQSELKSLFSKMKKKN